MNAIEFMNFVTGQKTIETRKLSAEEYFESEQGRKMMKYLRNTIRSYSNICFRVNDFDLKKINNNSLYKERDFFSDMMELGFDYKIISYHEEETPIKTYEFKVK